MGSDLALQTLLCSMSFTFMISCAFCLSLIPAKHHTFCRYPISKPDGLEIENDDYKLSLDCKMEAVLVQATYLCGSDCMLRLPYSASARF